MIKNFSLLFLYNSLINIHTNTNIYTHTHTHKHMHKYTQQIHKKMI